MSQLPIQPDRDSIPPVSSQLSWADRFDHLLARWAVNRSGHRVRPGLYALGKPTPDSPVFVTANYTLSFDALRSALPGIDGYVLVLDTHGINVWCAAGKGTFGTDELVRRITATGLADVVDHRKLILPQLGAAGVSAHEVKKRSGFKVEYGPVRAADLLEYLRSGEAKPAMRRVRFDLLDRVVLIPVELVHAFVPTAIAAAVLFLLGGWLASAGVVASVLAGVLLFPILLPWLPTREFSVKGFILGGAVALPFAGAALQGLSAAPIWQRILGPLSYLLAIPPVTAYLGLNFTGSTPVTSRTGVRREIFAYIPVMAWMLGLGLLSAVAWRLTRL